MQKEEFRNYQARSTDRERLSTDQTAICRILIEAQQPAKRLGFESNTARYKSKTLIYIFQVLRVSPMRSMRFYNLLTLQAPTRDQIHIASTGGVKLLPKLSAIKCTEDQSMSNYAGPHYLFHSTHTDRYSSTFITIF